MRALRTTLWGAVIASTLVVLPFAVLNSKSIKTRLSDFEGRQQTPPTASSLAVTVQVVPAAPVPNAFALEQNYPNPFNDGTIIRYSCASDAHVTLRIYNVLGQEVKTLVSAWMPAGVGTTPWDGRDDHGRQVASGIYLYRIVAGTFVQTRILTLMK